MSGIPQQTTLVQYIADGSTTDFDFVFTVNTGNQEPEDVAVYLTPGTLQTLDVNYTVTFNDAPATGGTVIFNENFVPASGVYVTIELSVPNSLDVAFEDVQTFNGANLDNALYRLLLICQQNSTYAFQRNLSYPVSTPFDPNQSPEIIYANTQIPLLGNGQIWYGTGSAVVAVDLDQNPDVSVLQGLLAQEGDGTAGSLMVGYYDQVTQSGTTVSDYLDSLTDFGFNTGDIKQTYNPNPDTGWILSVNGSIGSANSAATYANSNTQNLYTLFWTNYNNTQCPVSGGRGASAGADFAANKTLALPASEGMCFIAESDTYPAGTAVGSATQTLSINNMPAHDHGGTASGSVATNTPYTSGPQVNFVGAGLNSPLGTVGISVTITSQGNGAAFSIIQPSMPTYVWIKL